MRNRIPVLFLFLLLLALTEPLAIAKDAQIGAKLLLNGEWRIQPSSELREGGEVLSKPNFPVHSWYPASVPSTVLAALVKDEVYLDPYFGKNLRSIPGTTYPIGTEAFMLTPMSPESPFRSSWWYR